MSTPDDGIALIREALDRVRHLPSAAAKARAIGTTYTTTYRWTTGKIAPPEPPTLAIVRAFLGGEAATGVSGAAASLRQIARTLRQQADDLERRAAALERAGGE